MDGTLTHSRSKISDTMVVCLRELVAKGGNVIIVSGATKYQILEQVGEIAKEVVIMAQNGNHAELPTGDILWRNELTQAQKKKVFDLASKMIEKAGSKFHDSTDLVEDRVCQVSYSLIGHNAPLEKKEVADPQKEIRKNLLCHFEEEILQLNNLGVHARIGGTTCIDFTICHKVDNVKRLVEHMGWKKEECVYVGDALFEGGNDHSVVGVVSTQEVVSPMECEILIRDLIKERSKF